MNLVRLFIGLLIVASTLFLVVSVNTTGKMSGVFLGLFIAAVLELMVWISAFVNLRYFSGSKDA